MENVLNAYIVHTNKKCLLILATSNQKVYKKYMKNENAEKK